eukprot:TRINITY_DN13252_c0_g3_i7.p1 TRINITY_DN13252_c0_g3~~TRINITY_DN13252_c0_g3_i7.p1  ORF type:complete len:412 (-),score=50.95 TRINITY_DN13252_c0_g3_i7:1356-2591(-)
MMALKMRLGMVEAQSCGSGGECVRWVERYLGDCVCSLRDYFSLGFGLIGCISWAVSEVPQIFTNFKSKSTEGVSLLFLMTWVVGDVFNLVGCVLESSTLPTQLYTAVLYTATTLLLVWQTIYYGDYFKKCWIGTARFSELDSSAENEEAVPRNQEGSENHHDMSRRSSSSPIPTVSPPSSVKRNTYLKSARPPATTRSPTWWRSSLGAYSQRSSPGYMPEHSLREDLHNNSDDEEEEEYDCGQSNPPKKSILPAVALTFFMMGGGLHYSSPDERPVSKGGTVLLSGRKLLQELGPQYLGETSSSPLGTLLGWVMAAIYMGGRLPQIYLNIRRGTVEGLNPLMFMFAVGGNAAYVASILVRTTEWKKLKPNLPWLVDALVCVLLDFLVYFYPQVQGYTNRIYFLNLLYRLIL